MILIIQTGDPVAAAQQQFGTFDQWFTTAMGGAETAVVNVHQHQQLPATIEHFSGIVITGSPAMVTDQDDWLVATQNWLEQPLKQHTPTLGVCFGHQLLADMLGGEVAYNDKGRNLGHSEFMPNEAAESDALLGPISHLKSIATFASHLQQVKRLPDSAIRLGHCEKDENHAFSSNGHIWGLQFHPEWNRAITRTYIEARAAELIQEGLQPDEMIQRLKPAPAAYALLKRFSELAEMC